MPSRAENEELTRAFTTHLGDETAMTPIVDEGLQTVVSQFEGTRTLMRRGMLISFGRALALHVKLPASDA